MYLSICLYSLSLLYAFPETKSISLPLQIPLSHPSSRSPYQTHSTNELDLLLQPFHPDRSRSNAGSTAIAFALRTYIANRWGMHITKNVRKKWGTLLHSLSTWNPKRVVRLLRKKTFDPRIFTDIKRFSLSTRLPLQKEPWPTQIGTGGIHVKMKPLPLRARSKKRSYLMTIKAFSHIHSLNEHALDPFILKVFQRLTDPNISPVKTAQKQDHSQKILRWISSLLPKTMKQINHFFEIKSLLQPIDEDQYNINTQLKWKRNSIIKDYPKLRKRLTNSSSDFSINTEFLSRKKLPWLHWSYQRKNLKLHFQGKMQHDGFLICDRDWKALQSWRPTKHLHTKWHTKTSITIHTSLYKALVKDIVLSWKIRKIRQGVALTMQLIRQPVIQIEGSDILRSMLKLIVPGGVEKIAQRMMYNLAYGINGKGVSWKLELKRKPKKSTATFTLQLPMKHDPVVSSLLQFASTLKTKKNRKAQPKRLPIWSRIYRAIYQDLLQSK